MLKRSGLAAAGVGTTRLPGWVAAIPSLPDPKQFVANVDRARILKAAESALVEKPLTVVDVPSAKSPGGRHDYFSQADYFWPNPANPSGPYINRDGQSNPDNFDGHRHVMVRLSLLVPQLTAAWMLTGKAAYADAARAHLRAWFVTPDTRMNPNLEYSQGVVGVSTGRSYGIIDTLHLVEVARSAVLLQSNMPDAEWVGVTTWFREYLKWMDTSQKGVTERDAKNNHATCWALQAAEFARVNRDEGIRDRIRQWYMDKLLTTQMAPDGSFPLELARTKPYSYSIFNFDVTVCLAQSLTVPGRNVVQASLPDGRGACRAAAWLYPYLRDKSSWPYAHDVQHFDALPVRSPGLLFTGLACNRPDYLDTWKRLNPDPSDREVIRNYPVRQPLLWVS